MSMFLVTLLASSLTMSVVILSLWLAGKLLPHKISATCRYYMWLIVLIGLLIPFRPNIPIPLKPIPISSLFEASNPVISMSENELSEQIGISVEELQTSNTVSTDILSGFVHNLSAEKRPVNYSLIMLGIWIAGALSVLLYHVLAYGKFISAVRRWGEVTEDKRVLSIMQTVWEDMKLKRRKVMIKTCALVSSPMMIGFHKSVILLPEKSIASDELEYIIRHELTHYRRKDMWINLLHLLVMSMYWFNPFVYLMGKMLRTDCEASCDEMVMAGSNIGRRKQYGETIISFARSQSARTPILSTYFYGGKNDMKKRLLSIMDTGRKSKLWATACVTAVVAMTLLSGTAFAASTSMNQYISEAEAKKIAFSDAGISESQATSMKIEFDYDDGLAEYEIEWRNGQTKYDYEVNAVSGAIISRGQETKNTVMQTGYTAGATVSESAAEDKALDLVGAGSVILSETKYKKDGRIEYKITVVSGNVVYKIELYGDGTLKKMEQENVTSADRDAAPYANHVIGNEEAARIALEKSGGGTVLKCKLDYKKEGLRYEVKIINNSIEYKAKINAKTGAIYDYSYKSW